MRFFMLLICAAAILMIYAAFDLINPRPPVPQPAQGKTYSYTIQGMQNDPYARIHVRVEVVPKYVKKD